MGRSLKKGKNGSTPENGTIPERWVTPWKMRKVPEIGEKSPKKGKNPGKMGQSLKDGAESWKRKNPQEMVPERRDKKEGGGAPSSCWDGREVV